MVKYLTLAIVAVALTACKPGERLGTFKNECDSRGGVYKKVAPNEYKCTLRNGTVLHSR